MAGSSPPAVAIRPGAGSVARLARWLLKAGLAVIAAVAFYAMLTAAMAGAWLWAALFCVLGLALLPVRSPGRAMRLLRGVMLLATLVLPLTLPAPFIRDAQGSMDRMWRVVETSGSGALAWRQRAAIWNGNVIMAAGGALLGYPEAALETLGMIVPADSPRDWASDFAMASPKVRMPLERFIESLPREPRGKNVEMPPVKLAWRHYRSDRRVALALNAPSVLHATARPSGSGWTIDCRITVPVAYPKRARVWFLKVAGIDFFVEEGLFYALQELGWLHAYNTVWYWELRS